MLKTEKDVNFSAAPGYFPVCTRENLELADGGLIANNPSEVLLDEFDAYVHQKVELVRKLIKAYCRRKPNVCWTFIKGKDTLENRCIPGRIISTVRQKAK